MEEVNLSKKLLEVQKQLKVKKGNYNEFGGYYYRSCEDILESVKPLLNQFNLVLLLSDDLVPTNNGNYIKATATLQCVITGETISVTALAREEVNKKKMDAAQMTGSASSYARKYALNGLFAIDDTKDADTNEYNKLSTQPQTTNQIHYGTNAYEKQIMQEYPPKQGVELQPNGLPKSQLLMDIETFNTLAKICKDNDNWYSGECEKLNLDRKKTKQFTQEQANQIVQDYYIFLDKKNSWSNL